MRNKSSANIITYDEITSIGASQIQHGKYNNRIYLMSLDPRDGIALLPRLDKLAKDKKYSKIFAKAPDSLTDGFLKNGYRIEARIPCFFQGRGNCCFFGKYFEPERAIENNPKILNENLQTALARGSKPVSPTPQLPKSYDWRIALSSDAEAISLIYQKVFETYPFPIHDPEYIRTTMKKNIVYFCVINKNKLAAVSSAEISTSDRAVEMTDFATLPEYRGRKLARFLLARMEEEMSSRNIQTAFTIARAMSGPMNAVFAAHNYKYGGTLTNNTQICGRLESMNVWHKPL